MQKKEEKIRNNLRHILPSNMLRNSRRRENPEDDSAQELANDCGVKMIWCGGRDAVTEVHVANMCQETVDWASCDGFWQLYLTPGTFHIEITMRSGRPVWSGEVSIKEEEWRTLEIGHLFASCEQHAEKRSQFSFPNGRSACSFLCCYATIALHEVLGLGSDIARTEVSGEDVMRVVDEGMSLFEDRDVSALLRDLGMEHMSVEEAIELCGHAWSDKGALRIKETFWGSLSDPSSIMHLIQEASSSEARPPGSGGSRNHGIKFLCMTKPPETVLMLVAPSLDLYSVLDTHTRTIGTSQYPASIYRCRNLEDLALLLWTNFFPLPPGIDIEELGAYAMFELVLLEFIPSSPAAAHLSSRAAHAEVMETEEDAAAQDGGAVEAAGGSEGRREDGVPGTQKSRRRTARAREQEEEGEEGEDRIVVLE
ncbi:hypothetical protein GUITHDRAFT_115333 [Guillardia theta CCMP2712]|uniref:Uncharacterized protein n=1 Tax=Guillardia theta (strain CCMP2712) TaxID=905079 RepID=L1IQM5_GUITC|nr:hypothetical protein GUITHDRAFT_115333 [Guillardia theta CCMP2712]EKX38558.1 hypothetical protein GUITHDRAFT_115333 [Guillardia theta CCMP2712]|eukprot:XP_005825538.1 hypothetical protein GUITHDRAFT_115333 [Guillardia theta CCMP2712]